MVEGADLNALGPGAAKGDSFGDAVAVSGTTVAVGAGTTDVGAGAAYIFGS